MTGKRHLLRLLAVIALVTGVAIGWSEAPAYAAPAPDANSVLILGESVTGGAGSTEAQTASALGYTVVVASDADWAAMSTSEFASYRAIIIGDPSCSIDSASIDAAEANAATWGPAVTGNVVLIGTDPSLHADLVGNAGAAQLIESGIAFAADESGKTGAYITLSCYYSFVGAGTAVPLLDNAFGSGFTVVGQFEFSTCPAESHVIASHPALAGLTSADLSNWGCSTHEAFETWPTSDFIPLAINVDIGATEEYCETSIEGQEVCGGVYILARGEGLIPGSGEIAVDFDVKPGSCPNPFNMKQRGVLPAAILGTSEFDINDIDRDSIRLEGVPPIRWSVEDVSRPFGGEISDPPARQDCTTGKRDGAKDLTLKFDSELVQDALGSVSKGDVIVVTITGELKDGTPFAGRDVIWIR